MTDIERHVDYLLVVLFSGAIMSEELFDRLAGEYMRVHGDVKLLGKIKDRMILYQHTYRLEPRGRSYLACLRHAGEIGNLKVMHTYDVMKVLDKLASLSDKLDPPRKKEVMR